MKRDVTMSGNSTFRGRPYRKSCMRRADVGWAHWRSRKKQATSQYRRRHLDKSAIQEGLDVDAFKSQYPDEYHEYMSNDNAWSDRCINANRHAHLVLANNTEEHDGE